MRHAFMTVTAVGWLLLYFNLTSAWRSKVNFLAFITFICTRMTQMCKIKLKTCDITGMS